MNGQQQFSMTSGQAFARNKFCLCKCTRYLMIASFSLFMLLVWNQGQINVRKAMEQNTVGTDLQKTSHIYENSKFGKPYVFPL